MNSKQQDLRQKTIVHLFLSQKARRRYLQAEPALCGNSIFGTTSDEAQPGSLWLEGFQVLPLQEPAVLCVGFGLLPGTLYPAAAAEAAFKANALPSEHHHTQHACP